LAFYKKKLISPIGLVGRLRGKPKEITLCVFSDLCGENISKKLTNH